MSKRVPGPIETLTIRYVGHDRCTTSTSYDFIEEAIAEQPRKFFVRIPWFSKLVPLMIQGGVTGQFELIKHYNATEIRPV